MGRDVDGVAERGQVVGAVRAGDQTQPGGAGVHADRDRRPRPCLAVTVHGRDQGVGGVDGAPGVIDGVVPEEQGDHAVADELVHGAVEALHDAGRPGIESPHRVAERGRREALREGRRAAHVGEENRHLALASRCDRTQAASAERSGRATPAPADQAREPGQHGARWGQAQLAARGGWKLRQ